jgi:poly(beta-D-mannuronate) lyase
MLHDKNFVFLRAVALSCFKFILLIFFLLPSFLFGQKFTNVEELCAAASSAKPGAVLVLADGVYNDANIAITAHGSKNNPVIIKAETPGKVFFSKKSSLKLGGTYVEINGFYFVNGYSDNDVIQFKNGKELAFYCRITNCVIENYNAPDRSTENIWVHFFGQHNSFDHNSLFGKQNNGCALVVELNEEQSRENYHQISHNYFGRRPNLGSNGGETIRVGNSTYSLTSSNTIIEKNFFEKCDGEVEVISVKSCNNIVRYNTLLECAGVIALRHGNNNEVYNNSFIGNNKPFTGGVRIINEGQKVHDNYFYKLKGDRFFAALAVMNGVPNSLPNRYMQVKNVTIFNNAWVDCDNIQLCVGADYERTAIPENVKIENNIFYNKRSDKVYAAFDNISGFTFSNNIVATRSGKFLQKGFVEKNIPEPTNHTNSVSKELCGAKWFVPTPEKQKIFSGKKIEIKSGQNTILEAIKNANEGDIIELAEAGDYLIDKTIDIAKFLRIAKSQTLKQKPVLRYNGTESKTSFITISDGGMLELDGLSFDGNPVNGNPAPAACITTAKKMAGAYSASINNCDFGFFQESTFNPFKATPTSYADTLRFINCFFHDLSGDAIFLAAEKDDAGKYNAEYVEIRNCSWYKVLGAALNLYRGGNDESTTGPTLQMSHCVFEDVNNREQGYAVKLVGVQEMNLSNLAFSNSGRGGASIFINERRWDKIVITHCNLYNSGKIFSFFGKAVTGSVFNFKPEYISLQDYNFKYKPGNPLLTKGTNGGVLGIK